VLPVRWQKSGEKTPTESDSSEEEEQGEVTPPPQSLPCITPLSFGDIVDR
jgi:hypothetical protein